MTDTFTFNLQDHLRDMEDRLAAAMETNRLTSDAAHRDLKASVSSLDAKIDSYNNRLTTAEADIKFAKKLGFSALTGAISAIVSITVAFIRERMLR